MQCWEINFKTGGNIRNMLFEVYSAVDRLEVFEMKMRWESWEIYRTQSFFSRFVSHLDLWHNVCNKPATLLFVQKMFCDVSYFHSGPSSTKKSLCEAHTSLLFSFSQELASASLIRQTAPLIYCCWKNENIISNDGATLFGHFKMTKKKVKKQKNTFCLAQMGTPYLNDPTIWK